MKVLLPLLLAASVSALQPATLPDKINETTAESQAVTAIDAAEYEFPALQPGVISDRTEGTIYIGDSRFVQIDMYLGKGDGYIIAKVSQGHKWLVEEAMPKVNEIKAAHPEVASWTIVSNLGVNDLYNIDKYLLEYQKIVDGGDRLVIMSVNPCDGKRSSLNAEIDSFNEKMQDSGFEYLDMAGYLKTNGFSTSDGVHYTKDTCTKIWNQLNYYLSQRQEKD